MRSYGVSEAATSFQSRCRSFLDTISTTVHSLVARHHTGRSSEHRALAIIPSPRVPDPPRGSSEAASEEVQIKGGFGWLDLGPEYTENPGDEFDFMTNPGDEFDFETDARICLDLETKLIRQADLDDIFQVLKRRVERDKAQLESWENSLTRHKCLCKDEKNRSETKQGSRDIDAWKGCLDREFSRYLVEEHKLREEHNNTLATFLSEKGMLHLLKQDAKGWLMIPEEEDYLPFL